jgi:hypothetical protein
MGTQQILLIVLSVIIVGIAIAVGIAMFGNQAYNSNRQAVISELNNYAALTLQYWKTPASMGGAGQSTSNVELEKLANFIGFTYADSKVVSMGNWKNTSENGEFRLIEIVDDTVTLQGLGNELKGENHPFATTTVIMSSGSIQTEVGDQSDF